MAVHSRRTFSVMAVLMDCAMAPFSALHEYMMLSSVLLGVNVSTLLAF